jgi:antitoxin VapB
VRLTEHCHFPEDEVRIRRQGNALVLEPLKPSPQGWVWQDALVGDLDEDFVKAALDRPKAEDR